MAGTNGRYVTAAELHATVEPIQADIGEIKADVKSLLTGQAGAAAIATSRASRARGRQAWVPPLVAAAVAGSVSLFVAVLLH